MANAVKKVILQAMVEGALTDLMAKTGADNVYIDDKTTVAAQISSMVADIALRAKSTDVTIQINNAVSPLAKKTEVTTEINNAVSPLAKKTDVTTEISAAISKLINGAPETYDTLKEIADYIASHDDVVTALNGAIGKKADKSAFEAVKNTVDALGALANKSQVSEADLDTALAAKVKNIHTHSNKTVLDGVTAAKVSDWDNAATNSHTHANKALLDTYKQTEANLADAVSKKHSHSNASVLDGITSAKVTAWNGKANVYVQATQPTGLVAGDLWIQTID